MLIFRRLFNFEKEKLKQSELRLNHRYTPGAAFPLRATLNLGGRNCSGVLQNISGNGVGLLIGSENPVTPEQSVRVLLELDQHRLDIPARLAHVAPQAKGIYCGLGLSFDDFLLQKTYLQLLQPIAIGQSLQPVAADRVIQNEPQFIKQIYRGESGSALTVWLAMTLGTPLHSFEFRMSDYFCRADMATGVLEAYTLEESESHKGKLSTPVFDVSGGLNDEIRQLFRWIVPNLSHAVPDDVRASLQRFAATK